tara:strand:+ start:261 stop:449 length:189 start_codon:yes stop_codon:yes gene_type:complete
MNLVNLLTIRIDKMVFEKNIIKNVEYQIFTKLADSVNLLNVNHEIKYSLEKIKNKPKNKVNL